MSTNRCIGKDGQIPWHLPEDLKHFKRTTLGHAVIMGRKTYESIGRPLPKRRNIVVSRNADLRVEGCEVAPSLETAIALAREQDELPFVIGGAAIYEAALPFATTVYLTEINREVEGDAFFPEIDRKQWRETNRELGDTEGVVFLTFERVS
jgi:dihydrofolate reductase